MDDFEPLIIAFACNWCSYAASDVAGVSRCYYPANVRIIRVMCTGMIDPIYILKAFEGGADGVLVAGCRPGDCHYISGNIKAEKMVSRLRTLLHRLGLEDERLRLQWISTGEGTLFAKTIEDMVSQLKAKDPLPFKVRQGH
ncbi:MAG: hydrogenase iron-sulfur subunit [Dehalococcoidia bacterium]|jgi:F420-non-reducing hydrogenase iron-sulfur subunit|nr:MAG: hydrogenase iron-sulfur subunit [Dehalococcoidia bacterium]